MIVRGRGRMVEFAFADEPLAAALAELRARLSERAGFYSGSDAVASFAAAIPDAATFDALRALLDEHRIVLTGIYGEPALAGFAQAHALRYLGQPAVAPKRVRKVRTAAPLSEAAQSLVADFAGARADLARRRDQIAAAREAIGQRALLAVAAGPAAVAAAAPPETLYHKGTLRGGQSLHHPGHIVVVGDVNPGAELVATGDIIVLGALRGVAHAGAQGDDTACVIALELSATQLRIATRIAVAPDGEQSSPRGVHHARIDGERIIIQPFGGVAV